MKIVMRIGDCVVEIDDNSAKEPLSPRWSDQLERLSRVIDEAEKTCITLYEKQMENLDDV